MEAIQNPNVGISVITNVLNLFKNNIFSRRVFLVAVGLQPTAMAITCGLQARKY